MIITIDSLDPEGKRRMVIATTVVGLVCSIVTMVLRVWARVSSIGRLYVEDWVMALALFLSFGFAICNFYGTVAPPDRDYDPHAQCNCRSDGWIG